MKNVFVCVVLACLVCGCAGGNGYSDMYGPHDNYSFDMFFADNISQSEKVIYKNKSAKRIGYGEFVFGVLVVTDSKVHFIKWDKDKYELYRDSIHLTLPPLAG